MENSPPGKIVMLGEILIDMSFPLASGLSYKDKRRTIRNLVFQRWSILDILLDQSIMIKWTLNNLFPCGANSSTRCIRAVRHIDQVRAALSRNVAHWLIAFDSTQQHNPFLVNTRTVKNVIRLYIELSVVYILTHRHLRYCTIKYPKSFHGGWYSQVTYIRYICALFQA
jgi:hypothetical protein